MQASPDVPLRVQIVLFDGFDPLDAIGPFEVFHAAGLLTDGAVTVELVGISEQGPVASGCDLALVATAVVDPSRSDIILLPGAAGRSGLDPGPAAYDDGTGARPGGRADRDVDIGNPDPDSVPMRLARTLETPLPGILTATLAAPDVVLACVCGGSLIPAMAGLLEGRNAVTHHLGTDLLDAAGVNVVPARVVDDGDLVSGGGVTSGLDVAFHLVERFLGPRVANAVEDLFEFERRGTVWRPTGLVPTAP